MPLLFHDRSSWPTVPVIDSDGDENCLAKVTGRDIAFISAKAGDLIVWDWRLPHSNSKTLRPGRASPCAIPRLGPGAAVAVFPGG